MPFDIEPLSREHEVEVFDCGEESLNRYLRRFAWQNDRIGLGRTFVAVEPGQRRVLGYDTLSNGSVIFDIVPGQKKYWPKYPIPVTLVGRLAADLSVRGRRLGETLLVDALRRALRASYEVASYAVVVDALDDGARAFYLRYGFQELFDDPRHLFLPMKTVARLGFRA